jgi:hypothetical protein
MDMSDLERATFVMTLGMAGSIARAVTRRTMDQNRAPSQSEVDFLAGFADKTSREIGEFCFDLGFEPQIVLQIHEDQTHD